MAPWPGKGMISIAEFGEYAQLSGKVIRKMIEDKELFARKLGKEWRIPRAEAFRVLGLVDPEGTPPVAMPPIRPAVNARVSTLLQGLRS